MNYTTEELDDAAVWIARLRAPDRSARVEKGFRRWLAEKPSHAAAFETISTAWELTGALKRRPFPTLTRWERAGFRTGFFRATSAVAAAAALLAIGLFVYLGSSGIATNVGEQRVMTLEDGTRMSLNTSTRAVVHYDQGERRIELKGGEALFEVARDPARPFVVVAGARRIEALGTTFIVREDEQTLSVTLMEGKVAVSPRASDPSVVLMPGQRLTLTGTQPPRLDAPGLEKMTAWRRGQIELEEAPLAEAARDMNRYSTLKIRIEDPQAARLRINGVFRTGDTAGFAAAVARSYGLGTRRGEHEIVLTGVPVEKALSTAAPR